MLPSAVRVWKIWCVMMYNIRNVRPSDLQRVTALEAKCFPVEEAAGERAFAYRIASFPERFFVAEAQGEIIGLVNGCASSLPFIDDSLFEPQGHEPTGKNQMVFGLAVHPLWQNQGIGSALLRKLIDFARESGMKQVVLTCKEEKLSFYQKFGFVNYGVSKSVHGGKKWFDLALELNKIF